ncbi:variable surface protein [Plasmodium gonderi]|uniref:Variable surface protein n=1 Tax=Plasmodium gonderi TaxID=77519 RepID=A0A1Y1JSW8_PLAGO|nr:variable surface protein [Plasmodium gonderi]GAW84528.1 variable surface protein [Plasmodium gonderi]
MENSIYKFLPLLPIYNEIMNNYKNEANTGTGGSWHSDVCNIKHRQKRLEIINDENLKKQNICTEAMLYLVDIQTMDNSTLEKSSCIYLYFWLSHNLKHINNIEDITNNYDNLLKLYESFGNGLPDHKCNKYKIQIIEDLRLIKDIHDIHNYAKKRKIINLNKDATFVQKAMSLKNYYDKKIQTKGTVTCDTKMTSVTETAVSCKNNIAFPIIITLFVTSLITISLFILHKYTSFSSYLKSIISYKRNKYNHIGEEINRFHGPQISNSIVRDDEYYMLYNYQKY